MSNIGTSVNIEFNINHYIKKAFRQSTQANMKDENTTIY